MSGIEAIHSVCVASPCQLFSGGSNIQDGGFLQKASGQHDACRPGLLPVPVGWICLRHLPQHTEWVMLTHTVTRTLSVRSWKMYASLLLPRICSQKKLSIQILIMPSCSLPADMKEPVFEFIRPPVYHPPQVKFPQGQPLRYLDRYRDGKEQTYGIYWWWQHTRNTQHISFQMCGVKTHIIAKGKPYWSNTTTLLFKICLGPAVINSQKLQFWDPDFLPSAVLCRASIGTFRFARRQLWLQRVTSF